MNIRTYTEIKMTRRTMQRGKQQVMFGLLPGKMFDFQGTKEIARVKKVRGIPDSQLNIKVVLRKIQEDARSWSPDYRPDYSDDFLSNASNFILINPNFVESELFPTVLHCQNKRCGQMTTVSIAGKPNATCRKCGKNVSQLTFVKVHRCGSLQELKPPACQKCHEMRYMALDMRDSERIANFRWVCRKPGCGTVTQIYSGNCSECQWQDSSKQKMDIQKHRAGSTFYPRTVTLLNLPEQQISNFLDVTDWEGIAAAKFLGLTTRKLSDFSADNANQTNQTGGLSPEEMDELMDSLMSNKITSEEYIEKTKEFHKRRRDTQESSSVAQTIESLRSKTGILLSTWQAVGQEMLEAVVPFEDNRQVNLFAQDGKLEYEDAISEAEQLGLNNVSLLSDFPMLTVSYGFSRTTYQPDECFLRPFPATAENNGKFPIYVDRTQADAIWISLNAQRVCAWLEANGFPPTLPPGTDLLLTQRGYFAQLFANLNYKVTLNKSYPQARMVFGLLHSLSHFCIKQASLLCGLDVTSLGEYLLPSALTFAISSNHRAGATIGALTALFEQVLAEWFGLIKNGSSCVYDPVCYEQTGSCHACTHLAEISCSCFNLNLSRAFLFGGYDYLLGEIKSGYLNFD